MRSKVVRALKRHHGFAVENPCLPGTPDINYVGGWIELKWLRGWPKRAGTPVAIEHYSPQQRAFHQLRWHHGGAVYLLLQVQSDWLLFDGPTAAKLVGTATREELFQVALETWPSEAAMRRRLVTALSSHAP